MSLSCCGCSWRCDGWFQIASLDLQKPSTHYFIFAAKLSLVYSGSFLTKSLVAVRKIDFSFVFFNQVLCRFLFALSSSTKSIPAAEAVFNSPYHQNFFLSLKSTFLSGLQTSCDDFKLTNASTKTKVCLQIFLS